MRAKWPAADFATYLDTPLHGLRARFGIVLPVQPRRPGTGSGGAALRHVGDAVR